MAEGHHQALGQTHGRHQRPERPFVEFADFEGNIRFHGQGAERAVGDGNNGDAFLVTLGNDIDDRW